MTETEFCHLADTFCTDRKEDDTCNDKCPLYGKQCYDGEYLDVDFYAEKMLPKEKITEHLNLLWEWEQRRSKLLIKAYQQQEHAPFRWVPEGRISPLSETEEKEWFGEPTCTKCKYSRLRITDDKVICRKRKIEIRWTNKACDEKELR